MPHPQPVTGNTEHTRPENRAFYPALDGLRALAFLLVFGVHYLGLPWGWTGVDLFFVLSGFLITGILYDTRHHPHRIRNFYLRRTLRIFPLYYGILLALVLAWPLMRWQWSWHWLLWPAYLGNFARFAHPYLAETPFQQLADFQPSSATHELTLYLGHFWSLCVEEQFYLLWPWAVWLLRDRRKLAWLCTASLTLCLALRLAGAQLLPAWMLEKEVLYRITPFRLDALLLGGLIALLLRGPMREQVLRAGRIAFFAMLAAIALWFALTPYGHLGLMDHYLYPAWKFTWGLTVIDLFYAALILYALQPHTVIYRVFRFAPLRWLGRISYGLYVFHDIPHDVYNNLLGRLWGPDASDLQVAALALPCTIAIAWLSFRLLETPFLNLKDRWTKA